MKTIQTKQEIIYYKIKWWEKLLIRIGLMRDKRYDGNKTPSLFLDEVGQCNLPNDYVDMKKFILIKDANNKN